MGINSLIQLSSELIGVMGTDDINSPDLLKNLYKKLMTIMMQALGGGPEDTLLQLNGMRDALTELIDDIKNGNVTIPE